jgi:hypothetical protein
MRGDEFTVMSKTQGAGTQAARGARTDGGAVCVRVNYSDLGNLTRDPSNHLTRCNKNS